MKKYDGHLKLNWIHNFNDSDGIAKMMAEAALCVDRVKPRHSVDFLAAFAKDASHADENGFYQWAESNGIDSTSLKKCLVEKSNNELVSQHLDYSRKVGIVANPTIWVEGRTLQGVVSSEQLEKLIDESIRTKGSGKLAALWRRIKFMVGI